MPKKELVKKSANPFETLIETQPTEEEKPAQKKQKKPLAPALARYTIAVPYDTLKILKHWAVDHDMTIKEANERAILEFVERHK